MREILFRGKRMNNGEWVNGSFLLDGELHRPYGKEHLPFSNCYIVPETDSENVRTAFNDGSLFLNTTAYHVIPETVGQFTGLTDKNGTKIFEGDIVESEFTTKPYLVCFGEYTYTDEYGDEESVCGWYNEEKGGYVTGFGCPDTWATVIGNIHDNPELLEG